MPGGPILIYTLGTSRLVLRRLNRALLPFLLKDLGLTVLRLKVLREVVRLRLNCMFLLVKQTVLIYYSITVISVMRRFMAALSKLVSLGYHSKGWLLLVKTMTLGLSHVKPPLIAHRKG